MVGVGDFELVGYMSPAYMCGINWLDKDLPPWGAEIYIKTKNPEEMLGCIAGWISDD